jgi:HK97 family phage major capsid protein
VLKVASLTVLSDELVMNADPQSEAFVRADLVRALADTVDRSFIDPDNAGVTDVTPAAVTNGVTPIAATGDPAADIAALIEAFDGDLSTAYMVAHPTTGAQLALYRDAAGNFPFLDAGPRGGTVAGIPLLTARTVPRDSNGSPIALIDASGIAYGDESTEVKVSRQASVEMSDTPTSDSGTILVSLFQIDATGVLIEQALNFKVARSGSVAVLSGADYQ